jgi:hypothetical protein
LYYLDQKISEISYELGKRQNKVCLNKGFRRELVLGELKVILRLEVGFSIDTSINQTQPTRDQS